MIHWYIYGYVVVAQFVIGYLHALYGRQGSQLMQVVYGVLWPIILPFMIGVWWNSYFISKCTYLRARDK